MVHSATEPLAQIITWCLSAFFLVGFFVNTFAIKLVGPEYKRWGYPDWFHYVSGGLELCVAGLLITPHTRPPGIALGVAIMVAAIVTVICNREPKRALPPLITLLLLGFVGFSVL